MGGALEYLHRHGNCANFANLYQCNLSGILHRDLKPDNILGVTNPVTGLVRWKECILIPYMFHFISLSLQKYNDKEN